MKVHLRRGTRQCLCHVPPPSNDRLLTPLIPSPGDMPGQCGVPRALSAKEDCDVPLSTYRQSYDTSTSEGNTKDVPDVRNIGYEEYRAADKQSTNAHRIWSRSSDQADGKSGVDTHSSARVGCCRHNITVKRCIQPSISRASNRNCLKSFREINAFPIAFLYYNVVVQNIVALGLSLCYKYSFNYVRRCGLNACEAFMFTWRRLLKPPLASENVTRETNSSRNKERPSRKRMSWFTPFLYVTLILLVSAGPTTAQGRRRNGRQSVATSVSNSGWLLRNLLNMPSKCDMEGSLAPCTFILTCLIQGGFPVNKCGGGYIYTCCAPGGSRGPASPGVSVRSDLRSGPTLRHIGGLFRENPPSVSQNSLGGLLPLRDSMTSSPRLHFTQNGGLFPPRDADDSSYYSNNGPPVVLSNSVVPEEGNLIEPTALERQQLVNRIHPEQDIYYNEPECGVQRLPSNMLLKRIIGGDEAYFAELPWQAHIRIAGYQCGGVLVNKFYVATAAHCVHKARLRDITVHLGEFDTKDTGKHYEPYPKESFGVVEKRTHPNFKYMLTQPDRFDVAVLRLSRPVFYRPNIIPICLPPPGNHFTGMMGVVAGWGKIDNSYGKTGTNILRKVNVPIIDNQECLRWHHLKNIDVKLHYEMFCAGHSQGKMDACLGDSGGPLVVNNKGRWTLAGITSAGFGCAVDHQPGIYHKVAITSGWIAANIRP